MDIGQVKVKTLPHPLCIKRKIYKQLNGMIGFATAPTTICVRTKRHQQIQSRADENSQ